MAAGEAAANGLYEGGEKAITPVIPDGIRGRYPGGAHDGARRVGALAPMWVVPQENLQLLSLYPKKDRDKSFFIS